MNQHTLSRSVAVLFFLLLLSAAFGFSTFALEETTGYALSVFADDVGGTVSVEVNGTVQMAPYSDLKAGDSVVLKANPAAGYFLEGFFLLKGTVTSTQNGEMLTFVMPAENVEFKALFQKKPSRSVTLELSAFGVAEFRSEGTAYFQGDRVCVEAKAKDGYRFVGWETDSSVLILTKEQKENPILHFTMPDQNVKLGMKYEPIIYYFQVNVIGNGSVEVLNKTKNSNGYYECTMGEMVTIRSRKEAGDMFSRWSGTNGVRFSSYGNEDTTITCPPSDFSICATFVSAYRNLTLSAGIGGSISPEGGLQRVLAGKVVGLSAIPQTGYVFSHWECSSPDGSFGNAAGQNTTFVMPEEDCTVVAVFEKGSYRLNVESGTGGSVEWRSGSYQMGVRISLKALPQEGYVFSHWECSYEGAVTDPEKEETLVVIPDRDLQVVAVFQQKGVVDTENEIVPPSEKPPVSQRFPWKLMGIVGGITLLLVFLSVLLEGICPVYRVRRKKEKKQS